MTFLFAFSAKADLYPQTPIDVHARTLALKELALTQGFEYYKNTQCIRLTQSEHLQPFSPVFSKDRPQHQFISFEICDQYNPKKTSIDRAQKKNFFECSQCKPLLPELLVHPKFNPQEKYYFDVSDVAKHKIKSPKIYIGALYTLDFATLIPFFSGISWGLKSFGFFTRSQLQSDFSKAFIKKFSSTKYSMNELQQISKTIFNKTRHEKIILSKYNIHSKPSASVSAFRELSHFLIPLPLMPVDPFENAISPLIKTKNDGKDLEEKILSSFGTFFSKDTHWSLERYLNPDVWNDEKDQEVRTDRFKDISQDQCNMICQTQVRDHFLTKAMNESPLFKGCSAQDLSQPQTQFNALGQPLHGHCALATFNTFVHPKVIACKKRCMIQDCAKEVGFFQTPTTNVKDYLIQAVQTNANTKKEMLDPFIFADRTPCVVFPKYKELSLPEIAVLMATLLRHSAPDLPFQNSPQIPSEKFEMLEHQNEHALFLNDWESFHEKHPTHLTHIYQTTCTGNAYNTLCKPETKKQIYIEKK